MRETSIELESRRGTRRARWAAIGAAIAVSIGAGGMLTASASIGTGERAVYVPITPCRVMDTRPAPQQVGPRNTPLGVNDTHAIQVRGTNGNCTIPADAVGLVLNVAAVNPTAGSFLTVFPSDQPRPLAANLNWVSGQAPVSNAVTADIAADGRISFYNLAGTVDLTADIVGFYVDHHHDDRYAPKPTGAAFVILDPSAFRQDNNDPGFNHSFANGRLEGGASSTCAAAPVYLPQGATVTSVTAHVADSTQGGNTAGDNVTVKLWRNPIAVNGGEEMFSASTTNAPGNITLTGATITGPKIDNTLDSYFASVCGMRTTNFFFDLIINYTHAV